MILRRAGLLIILFFFSCSPLYPQNFKGRTQNISISKPGKELRAGETLDYSVEWLGIPVGRIVLKVEDTATINNNECYHITARAIPNRFFQRFYDLEYTVHTYVDKRFHYPHRFEKIRRLNKEYHHIIINFDQEGHKAAFFSEGYASLFKISPERHKIEAKIPTTAEIPYGTQDLLSSFYYFRLADIRGETSYPLNIYYNQRNWRMEMRVGRPFLREMRRRGTFPAVEISPDSLLNSYILGKRSLMVYLTADSLRIPIEFKLETALGPISARVRNLP